MEMTGYLGKKVDIECVDGQKYSGYVFEVHDAEESDIGQECVDIALLDAEAVLEIAIDDIAKVEEDSRFRVFDFQS